MALRPANPVEPTGVRTPADTETPSGPSSPIPAANPPATEMVAPAPSAVTDAMVTPPQTAGLRAPEKRPALDSRWVGASFDTIMTAVREDGMALEHLPAWVKSNREMVRVAVSNNADAFRFADASLQSDRNFLTQLVYQQPGILEHMPEAWRTDVSFALTVLRNNPAAAGYFAPEIWQDPDVARAAVAVITRRDHEHYDQDEMRHEQPDQWLERKRDTAVHFDRLPEVLRDDAAVMLALVRINGLALEYASPRLRADADLVTAAVQNVGLALEFAHPSLQANVTIAEAAVRNWGDALRLVPAGTELNRDAYLQALRMMRDPESLAHIPEALGNDPGFAREAVRANGMWLARCPTKASDRDWALDAVSSRPEAVRHIARELRSDPEIMERLFNHYQWQRSEPWLAWAEGAALENNQVLRNAINANRDNLQYLPATITGDKARALELLRESTPIYAALDESLRRDPEIVRAAIVSHDNGVLEHLPHDTPGYAQLVREALERNSTGIEHARLDLGNDWQLVALLAERNSQVLAHVPAELFAIPEFVDALQLESHSHHLRSIPTNVPGYLDMVRRVITRDSNVLQWMPTHMITRELLDQVMEQGPHAIQYAPLRFRNDPAIMVPLVRQSPHLLQYAGSRITGDRELVLQLVAQNGDMLAHVAPALQRDDAIVRAALAHNPMALRHVDPAWLVGKTFAELEGPVRAALSADLSAFIRLPPVLRRRPEVINQLLEIGGDALAYIDSNLIDVSKAIHIVERNAQDYERLPRALQQRPEIARLALAKNGYLLRIVPAELRRDPELVRLALEQSPSALRFADESLRSDPAFVRPVLEKEPHQYSSITGRARQDVELLKLVMRTQPHMYQQADESLRASVELALWAMARDGQLLRSVPAPTNNRRDVVLAAVRNNGQALQHAPESMRNDPVIVDAAMEQDPGALRHASEAIRSDPARARAAVVASPDLFRDLSILQDDADTLMAVICQSPHLLQHASERLRDNTAIVREATLRNGNALRWASPRLQNDRQLVLDALSTDGNALQYASGDLKVDRDFALAAVSIAPNSLAHLPEFTNDKEVVLAAVYTSGQALQHASPELRADPDVVLAAVMQNPSNIQHAPALASDKQIVIASFLLNSGSNTRATIPSALADDIDVCLAAVYADAQAYAALPLERQQDPRIALAAVRRHRQVYGQLPEALKSDPAILRAAISANGLLLEHAPAELKNDPALVAVAVADDPLALRFAHADRRADPTLVRLAVERDGNAIQYAAAELRDDVDLAFLAVLDKPGAFAHLGALKRDRAFILRAVRHSVSVLDHLPALLRRDPSFMLAAVKENGMALSRALPPASTQRDIVAAAVAADGDAYGNAGSFKQDAAIARAALAAGARLSALPDSLRWQPELVEVALDWDPRKALGDLPGDQINAARLAKAITIDPTVVDQLNRSELAAAWRALAPEQRRSLALAAVRKDGMLLQHLEGLKGDAEIVMAAVRESGEALQHADESLRADRAIVLAAMRRNRAGIDYALDKGSNNVGGPMPILHLAAPELRRDREIVMAAVTANAQNLGQAHPSMRADRDIVKAAVEQDGVALQWVTDIDILDDEEIARIAVHTRGRAYTYLSARLKLKRDIAMAALRTGMPGSYGGYSSNPGQNTLLARVPWQLRGDRELISTAILSNEQNYAAAPLAARLEVKNAALAVANGWHQFVAGQGNYKAGDPVTQLNALAASIPAPLRRDAATMLELLEHDRSALPIASWEVLSDPEFQVNAVRNNPLLLLTTSGTRDNKQLRFTTPIDLDAVERAHPELRAEADELLGHLARLRIDYTGRMGTGPMVRSVVANRLALERGDRSADKPFALVIYPAADHNAALHSPRVEKIAAAYDVLYFEVKNEEELIEALSSSAAHRPADLVLLAGHGNGWALRLDEPRTDDGEVEERHTLDLTDRAQLVNPAMARTVRDGANVMIISCSNARGRDTRYNLAHLYAEMFPTAWVHAAVFPTNARIQLSGDGTFLRSHYLGGHQMGHTIPPAALGQRPLPEEE